MGLPVTYSTTAVGLGQSERCSSCRGWTRPLRRETPRTKPAISPCWRTQVVECSAILPRFSALLGPVENLAPLVAGQGQLVFVVVVPLAARQIAQG